VRRFLSNYFDLLLFIPIHCYVINRKLFQTWWCFTGFGQTCQNASRLCRNFHLWFCQHGSAAVCTEWIRITRLVIQSTLIFLLCKYISIMVSDYFFSNFHSRYNISAILLGLVADVSKVQGNVKISDLCWITEVLYQEAHRCQIIWCQLLQQLFEFGAQFLPSGVWGRAAVGLIDSWSHPAHCVYWQQRQHSAPDALDVSAQSAVTNYSIW